jgi:hypothetical protein
VPDKTNLEFIKTFPTLGDVQYKIATTREEMEGALTLVYKEYAKRRLILRENYKNEIRVSPHHLLPDTRIFVGLKNGEVIITLSTFLDSPLGLPLDSGYREEFQNLRDQGRKIGEAGYFAVKGGLFRGKTQAEVSIEKLSFICTIFRMAIQYGLFHAGADDACFVTNPDPKRKFFKYFPIQRVGEIKHYGFDEMHSHPKPAIAKRMDLRELRASMRNPLKLFKLHNIVLRLFLGRRMPEPLFEPRLNFSVQDLRYFFVEKSDVLKNLTPEQFQFVLSYYKLSQAEGDALLAGDC